MTKETRDQILELRTQGYGYVTIAHLVGESRDAVRYICKSRGLGGLIEDQMVIDGKVCANCGCGITQPSGRGRRKRFCSEKCRRAWWARHPNEVKKQEKAFYQAKCIHCGKTFTAYGNKYRKYCSRECYIQERFWT